MNKSIVYVIALCTIIIFTAMSKEVMAEKAKIKKNLKPSSIMDTYKGETVIISGKIICDNCKDGEFDIGVSSEKKQHGYPDVANIEMLKLGEYAIKVPKNFGKVNIRAVYFQSHKRDQNTAIRVEYLKNPLDIEKENISNIDIIFQEKYFLPRR